MRHCVVGRSSGCALDTYRHCVNWVCCWLLLWGLGLFLGFGCALFKCTSVQASAVQLVVGTHTSLARENGLVDGYERERKRGGGRGVVVACATVVDVCWPMVS